MQTGVKSRGWEKRIPQEPVHHIEDIRECLGYGLVGRSAETLHTFEVFLEVDFALGRVDLGVGNLRSKEIVPSIIHTPNHIDMHIIWEWMISEGEEEQNHMRVDWIPSNVLSKHQEGHSRHNANQLPSFSSLSSGIRFYCCCFLCPYSSLTNEAYPVRCLFLVVPRGRYALASPSLTVTKYKPLTSSPMVKDIVCKTQYQFE